MTQQAEALLKWCQENDITIHPHVSLQSIPNMGFGYIATAPIKSSEEVISVPQSCLLAYSSSEFKKLVSPTANMDQLDSMQLLALALMFEMKKPDSFYQHYIAVLPTSETSNLPMFWSESELSELENTSLEASLNVEQLEEDFHTKIKPITDGWSDRCTLTTYKTALAIILSRAFQAEDGSPYLCPAVDMLNASISTSNVQVGTKSGKLLAKTSRDIQQGEQVLNTYGTFSNSEVLRKYGYLEEDNPNDEVHIDMDIVFEVCTGLFGGELPEDRAPFIEQDTLVLPREPCATFIDDVKRVAELHVMDDDDFAALQDVSRTDGVAGAWRRFHEESGGMNEKQARGVALLVLGKKQSGYPNSAEDDRKWLGQHQNEVSRKKMALELRVSERTIIGNWMNYVKGTTAIQGAKKTKGKAVKKEKTKKKQKVV